MVIGCHLELLPAVLAGLVVVVHADDVGLQLELVGLALWGRDRGMPRKEKTRSRKGNEPIFLRQGLEAVEASGARSGRDLQLF